jgi:hypothetical protein
MFIIVYIFFRGIETTNQLNIAIGNGTFIDDSPINIGDFP